MILFPFKLVLYVTVIVIGSPILWLLGRSK